MVSIVRYLSRAARRDLASFRSLQVNNLFLFVALLIYGAFESGLAPRSAYPFLLLLGLLMLFPLSSDPLDRAPAVRLAVWPLTRRERLALRTASLALSPVLWLTVLLLLVTVPVQALMFLALAVAIHAAVEFGKAPSRVVIVPRWAGGFVQNSVRQILSLLDVYVALLLSAGGTAYRFFHPHPDPQAFPILAMLVALALSTWTQSLFGLDSASSMTRYRVMPLRGVRILWAKDIALLGILVMLVLPLDLRAGLTFGLAALAVGHIPSVLLNLPQTRWRFAGGRLIFGVVQVLIATALANGGFLAIAAAGWLLSLYLCGRWWDRHPVH